MPDGLRPRGTGARLARGRVTIGICGARGGGHRGLRSSVGGIDMFGPCGLGGMHVGLRSRAS
jgi:hypothetical protein